MGEGLLSIVSAIIGAARWRYDAFLSVGNVAKDHARVIEAQLLGERVNGDLGRREPPSGFVYKLCSCFFGGVHRRAPPQSWPKSPAAGPSGA